MEFYRFFVVQLRNISIVIFLFSNDDIMPIFICFRSTCINYGVVFGMCNLLDAHVKISPQLGGRVSTYVSSRILHRIILEMSDLILFNFDYLHGK